MTRKRTITGAASAASGPPEHVRRFAEVTGLDVTRLRWCRLCGLIAFAVDDWQRARLDRDGFTDVCPDCAAGWRAAA